MRTSKTPILLVCSVESGITFENMLRRNKFQAISSCTDAVSALQHLEKNPAQIVISEVQLDDVDGFELTHNLREIERTEGRYSYVILVTDQAVQNQVEPQWQAKADVILQKESLAFQLIPQVMAGERTAQQINRLIEQNRELTARCDQLEVGQLLDPLTGLGNRKQAEKGLQDTIRQIEARGGAVAVLLIGLRNIEDLERSHSREVIDELLIGLAEKIRRLVRPLDLVTYFDRGLFAVVMQHSRLEDCDAKSYDRIYQGIALKHFQTRAGYINPKIVMGACGSGAETGPPKVEVLLETAMSNLIDSDRMDEIMVSTLDTGFKQSDQGDGSYIANGIN